MCIDILWNLKLYCTVSKYTFGDGDVLNIDTVIRQVKLRRLLIIISVHTQACLYRARYKLITHIVTMNHCPYVYRFSEI
jgi:hypothetical protein